MNANRTHTRQNYLPRKISVFTILVLLILQAASVLSQTVTVNCYPQNVDLWTGSCNTSTKNQTSLMYSYGQVTTGSCATYGTTMGWAKFDLSAIPTSCIVNTAKVFIYTITQSGSPYFYIRRLTSDPVTASVATIRSQASAGAFYIQYTGSIPINQYNNFNLGATGVADVQSAISTGWFATSFYEYESGCYYMQNQGWNQANKPYLQIVYTPTFQNDVALGVQVSPVNNLCQGTYPVTVVMSNWGVNTITSDTIKWSVNGVQQPPYYWTGNLAAGGSTNVTVGNYTFPAGNVTITMQAVSPNGQSDPNPGNNSKTSIISFTPTPTISMQPTDQMTQPGGSAVFSLTGSVGATYQWQISTDGGLTYTNMTNSPPYSNVNSASMMIIGATQIMNGYLFKCIVQGVCPPPTTSNQVMLIVGSPVIAKAGVAYACAGGQASVPVTVNNMAAVSQFTLNININPAAITYSSLASINGAIAGNGTITGSQAGGKVTITWNGTSPVTIANGPLFNIVFTYLTGNSTVVWDTVPTNDCVFHGASGVVFASHYFNGNVYSGTPVITAQPQSTSTGIGQGTKFWVQYTGNPTIQWYVATNSPLYNNWTLVTAGPYYSFSPVSDTLYVNNAIIGMHNYRYKCTLTACSVTITSATAVLQVWKIVKTYVGQPSINGQFWKCIGDTVIIPIVVQNFDSIGSISLSLKYLKTSLQYLGYQNMNPNLNNVIINNVNTVGNDTSYVRVASYAITNISIPNNGVMVELKYKYLASCSFLKWDTIQAGVCQYSDVNLVILPAIFYSGNVCNAVPVINTQPLNQTVYSGDTATFSISATGIGTLTYQWQLSTDGGVIWNTVTNGVYYTGASSNTLKVTGALLTMNGYKYRCKVFGQCTPPISNAVTLTVNAPPIYCTLPVINACLGDTIYVPINVMNFNGVNSISLKIVFNHNQLSWIPGFVLLNSQLTGGSISLPFTTTASGNDTIIISWARITPSANIGTGYLCKLRFVASGLLTCSPLTFRTTPTGNCMFGNPLGLNIFSTFTNGCVNVFGRPSAYNVVTPMPANGHFCLGSPGVQIGLDQSQTGINYTLYKDGIIVPFTTVSGTGYGFTFGTYVAPGIYTVMAANPSTTCTRLMDGIVEVIQDAAPSVYNVSGTGSFCTGGAGLPVGLQNSQTGITYYLYLGSNPLDTVPGTTGSAISFGNQTTGGTYTVVGVNSTTETCPTNMTGNAVVTVNPLPSAAGVITGLSNVCQGQTSVTYTVPGIANATSYNWNVPTGATIISGSNTNSITVNFSASASSGNITVNGKNSCGDGTMASLAITVNLLPGTPGTITFTSPVCQGATGVTVSLPAITNASSYIWTLPPGCSVTSGAGTNVLTCSFNTTATSGSFTVKGHNTCLDGPTGSQAITISPLPGAAGTLTGTATLCQGSTYVYSLPPISNATSYVWTLPPNATGTSNTNSINVTYSTSATSGNITVHGLNACGIGSTSTLAITVNPLPSAPSSGITGPVQVCRGSSYSYSISPITNATTYSWAYTVGTGVTGISIINSISYNYSISATSGNVTVKGHNTCGDGPVATLAVNVNPLPTVNLPSFNSMCSEAAPLTLNTGTPAGGTYTGTGVTGNSFNPSTAGPGTWTITYTYTDGNTCVNNASKPITIISMPRATGTVKYDNVANTPLGNIHLRLKDGGSVTIDSLDTPSPTGVYWFRCLQTGTYSVQALTTRPWCGGCANATDALMVAQYSLGTISLSPFRQVAADVNCSGSINSGDALLIMKRFVGTTSSFAAGDWVFDVSNPYTIASGDVSKTINSLCVGDVNGSNNPTSKMSPGVSLQKRGVRNADNLQNIEVPLQAANNLRVNAISLVLDYPSDIYDVVDVNTNLQGLIYNIIDGQVRIAWYGIEAARFSEGDALVTLVLSLKAGKEQPQEIEGLNIGGESVLADNKAKDFANVILTMPSVKIGEQLNPNGNGSELNYYLGQNHPNPFNQLSEIEYRLPEQGKVKLSLLNLLGSEVRVLVDETQNAGMYQVRFDGTGMAPGVYLYKFQVEDNNGGFLKTRTLVIKD